MNIRGIRGVKVFIAAGLMLVVSVFMLAIQFSTTTQAHDGITIVPVLTSKKYPILLPNAPSKATIDITAPTVSPHAQAFLHHI